ncbi:PAS domain-containing protein [Aestuariispira insulae]|uniref:PAS domain-containing protein n=1 Tax=Aestuariispira insulae TaxID=1461337 RepID=A0A3D9HGL4_9PROT|nr:PAS domain-containing protein [Aestuariispira insulae]RED48555.1 PAS domain-containing protein [Aestuariispira insulae]
MTSTMTDIPGLTGRDLRSETIAFAHFWLRLPKEGLMPDRQSFRPEDETRLLPRIMLMELQAPDLICMRLIGTKLVQMHGCDRTGQNYLDFVEAERRPEAAKALWRMWDQPCGMQVMLVQKSNKGVETLSETIGFPMTDRQHGRKLLICHSTPMEWRDLPAFWEQDPARLYNVSDRHYIDIGAGIPD